MLIILQRQINDDTSVFPPGTIHSVYTDSVFAEDQFLIPQVMDRFVDVPGQTELAPSRTNDFKGVDFFCILENFIGEALESSSAGLTKARLCWLVLVLEKYIALKLEIQGRSKHDTESCCDLW